MERAGGKKQTNQQRLGTFLMGLSFLPFLLIYYPIIFYSLSTPPQVQATFTSGMSIHIPKIRVTSPVITNIDPWNQEEYKKALHKGIAHAKNSYLPGNGGTVFLFAHSSDSFINTARYNIPFLFLDNLEKNDRIFINQNGKKFSYKVREKIKVWPNETRYLKEIDRDQLILQTCYPLGTTFQRLLVFADPV